MRSGSAGNTSHRTRRGAAGPAALMVTLMLLAWPVAAAAQESPPSGGSVSQALPQNPLEMVQQAYHVLSGTSDGRGKGEDASSGDWSAPLSILALLTVLTVAPAILVMMTAFPRVVIVLALVRQALGLQTLPPSQVIVGLAMFLTFLIMAPTFERIKDEAISPLQEGTIDQREAWRRGVQPMRRFMFAQIRQADPDAEGIVMILNYRGVDTSDPSKIYEEDIDLVTLVPAFVLSELKVAFLMGFRLYLPFLVIDMVVSSVLISMGMMMLPPIFISLPFKMLMFVLVDGWQLVAGQLLYSFAVGGG